MQDEVFHRFVVGIFVDARIGHLSVDGHRFLFVTFFYRCNVEDILVTDGNIRRCAFQNATDVDAQHFQGAIGLHAVHDGMLADGSLGESCSGLYQCLDGVDIASYLIHARAEHGTLDFHHVLIAGEGRVDADRVLIHQFEAVQVELTDTEHAVFVACLTIDADSLRVGVTCESSGIPQQGGSALRLLHFVEHRALHLTRDDHQSLVGTHCDDVVVLQTDVASQLAIQQEVIDVDIA